MGTIAKPFLCLVTHLSKTIGLEPKAQLQRRHIEERKERERERERRRKPRFSSKEYILYIIVYKEKKGGEYKLSIASDTILLLLLLSSFQLHDLLRSKY